MRSSKYLLLPFVLFAAGCGKSTAFLSQETKSPDPVHRLHAVNALKGRPQEAEVVVPVLVAALQDENKYVRRDAAKALAQLGPAAAPAVPELRARVADTEPSVRKAATAALRKIDPAVVRPTVGAQ